MSLSAVAAGGEVSQVRERRKSRGISATMAKEEVYELEALNAPKPLYNSPKVVRIFPREIPLWTAALIIVGLVVLFFSAYALFFRLPRGLTQADAERHPNAFIAEHAAWHIGNLTEIGDRVAGHVNNEVHAVNYLLQAIDKIRFGAHTTNSIAVDHQIANGSYWRDKPIYSSLNVYRGIQNVVVQLGRRDDQGSDRYILLNSHFDSVSMSPGELKVDPVESCAHILQSLIDKIWCM